MASEATKTDDGGPADSMTIRDYFAAAALTGILGGRTLPLNKAGPGSEVDMSATSYLIADAMLAARKAGAQ